MAAIVVQTDLARLLCSALLHAAVPAAWQRYPVSVPAAHLALLAMGVQALRSETCPKSLPVRH